MSLAFWAATTSLASDKGKAPEHKAQSAPKGPPGGKCTVCHNPHNYHEINIPCDQVEKYLANHPGDYSGPCKVTSVTNK